jgi:hypothetical protein
MTSAPHTYDPPPVSWYGPPDDPAPLATWRALSDYQRDVARRLGITAAKARRLWG